MERRRLQLANSHDSGGENNSKTVGDIAYWDGKSVKTISKDKWNISLGTPIGVVVIPEGFLPDGMARIIALYYSDENGNMSDVAVDMRQVGFDSSLDGLKEYKYCPNTDNNDSLSLGIDYIGRLPSDAYDGEKSFVDMEANYPVETYITMIPSPYLGESLNPEYCKQLDGGNALSDFDGMGNTTLYVNSLPSHTVSIAAYNYSDGVSNVQWYLPSMGELGILVARLSQIDNSISAAGGVTLSSLPSYYSLWSSTKSQRLLWAQNLSGGDVYRDTATADSFPVRAFALI